MSEEARRFPAATRWSERFRGRRPGRGGDFQLLLEVRWEVHFMTDGPRRRRVSIGGGMEEVDRGEGSLLKSILFVHPVILEVRLHHGVPGIFGISVSPSKLAVTNYIPRSDRTALNEHWTEPP